MHMKGNIKITKEEIGDHDNVLGHLVINSLLKYPEIMTAVTNDGYAEVCMTVNGKEMYLKEFVDFWQGQVNQMIIEEAKTIVQEKMSGVSDLLYDLEERLEDWEKDND